MKHFGKGMLLVFVAWVPLIIWQSSPGWGPKILGAERFAAVAHSPLGTALAALAVILTAGTFLLGMFLLMRPVFGVFGGMGQTRRILTTGAPARAVVKAIGETSTGGVVTINDQPLLNLTLEVRPEFGSPYVVSFDAIIPRYAVPSVQPGAEIALRVDAADPQKVAIDWAAMGFGG